MNKEQLKRLLERIYNTREDEIDCGETYEALAEFVDMEISGREAADLLPLVHQHLDQCPPCYDLYDTLRAIAELEAEGRLDEIPANFEELFKPSGGPGIQPSA